MAAVPHSRGDAATSVSCVTTDNCVAVGAWSAGTTTNDNLNLLAGPSDGQPLIEHFNGTKWTIVQGIGSNATLYGVSCTSPSFCVAVGGTATGSNLALTFDGRNWRSAPVENVNYFATNSNRLVSVSCTSRSFCVAVGADVGGETRGGSYNQPVVEEFDGHTWQLASLSSSWHGSLGAVGCDHTWCLTTGVGEFLPGPPMTPASGAFGNESFVREDGQWIEAGDTSMPIGSLSCQSRQQCVGRPDAAHGIWTSPSRVFRFQSGRWTSTSLPDGPNEGTNGNETSGLSCSTVLRCTLVGAGLQTAAGPATRPGQTFQMILENNWSGKWRVVHPPNIGGRDSYLTAVSCVGSGSRCVAVGITGNFAPGASSTIPTRSTSVISS